MKRLCPGCGSENYEITTMAILCDKDTNRAYCSQCGWKGIGHDIVKAYRIILDEKHPGMISGQVFISEEGAKIIWAAYEKLFGKGGQSMETRESRGGVCWFSEIDYFKDRGALDKEFDYNDHKLETE